MSPQSRAAATSIVLIIAFSFQSAFPAETVPRKGGDVSDFDTSASEMRPLVERYSADRGNLMRYYNIESSPARRERLRSYYQDWHAKLATLNFEAMSQDGKVDYVLFRNHLDYEMRRLDLNAKEAAEVAAYLPFAPVIVALEESRRKMAPLDPEKAAAALSDLTRQIDAARRALDAKARGETGVDAVRERKIAANRALQGLAALRVTFRAWSAFYDAYDPLFTWWASEAAKTVDTRLESYTSFIRERIAGLQPAAAPAAEAQPPTGGRGGGARGGAPAAGGAFAASMASARPGSTDDIIGNPIGREGLMAELASEMIPYSPEELIAIAGKEFVWCENEMKKAAREMGFGDDWKKALEKVKTMHVGPGKQTQLIRELAAEAEKFIDERDLVTVPPIARETWRMEMMSPERQLVSPFFLGGEVITVSYPTSTMSFEQKMMSMRGNNIPMSRATVFHELIPGHHLQGYYGARYKPYRAAFGGTPFVTEGWALYWELLMWDLKFQKTPEDRVGALMWRMHRCARIVFSLSFHLGKMTPDQCIEMLVERVGHERENAIGEVRRSFAGAYSPLYQAAYLLGGMQIYALRKELVDSGKMTNKQFHDAILKENRIPVEMVRASLSRQKLTRDYSTSWKFMAAR